MIADMGMYREFPLPGAVGMGIQPWMRTECNVVWEVCVTMGCVGHMMTVVV